MRIAKFNGHSVTDSREQVSGAKATVNIAGTITIAPARLGISEKFGFRMVKIKDLIYE